MKRKTVFWLAAAVIVLLALYGVWHYSPLRYLTRSKSQPDQTYSVNIKGQNQPIIITKKILPETAATQQTSDLPQTLVVLKKLSPQAKSKTAEPQEKGAAPAAAAEKTFQAAPEDSLSAKVNAPQAVQTGKPLKALPVQKTAASVKQESYHPYSIMLSSCRLPQSARKIVSDYQKAGFSPYTPGFVEVPYGDARALRDAITPNTVAFLIEPIQGEGGIIVPPDGYLRAAREICTEFNVLMMADEIQTGLGRTGRLFACDHENVKPDVMILGKALSGGVYPVSMVLSSREVLGVFKPGEHGSTFGGNPLGCAVARTALKVLVEEGMIENSARLGEYFQERLVEINSPHVKEVRGKGLFIGVELHPEAGGARRFSEALQTRGVLAKETHTHIIRFAPPLIITREEIDWALERIQDVLMMP